MKQNKRSLDKKQPGKDQGLAVLCPGPAVQPGGERGVALSVPSAAAAVLSGAGLLPAFYLSRHGHGGHQVSAGGPVHPGLGPGLCGAGALPAQDPPVVCPLRASGDLCGAGHHPQRLYERLPQVLFLLRPDLRRHGELCGQLLHQHQLEGHRRRDGGGAAHDDLRPAAEGPAAPAPERGGDHGGADLPGRGGAGGLYPCALLPPGGDGDLGVLPGGQPPQHLP